jgi:Mg2+ and Co2+ transporter CorA
MPTAVITTILATTSALVGFYGMNLAGLGISSGAKSGSLIMLGALVLVGLGEYWYFKRKGWL